MRIISKFHDYYDIGLSYGIDKSLVYVRHEQELEKTIIPEVEKIMDSEHKKFWNNNVSHYQMGQSGTQIVNLFFVGFCGKIYVGFDIDWLGKKDRVYSKSDLDNFLKRYPKTGKEMKHVSHSSQRWNYISQYEKMVNFWNEFKVIESDEPFFELKTPIFAVLNDRAYSNQHKVTLNPILKDLKFQRVVDSYTAFQEISMYLGGVLGIDEVDTVDISNLDLIEQKGFDKKWSFRKHPDQKKIS